MSGESNVIRLMKQISKVVGTNVRKYRKKRGYTQEQLALYANVGSYYLSRLELGKENPTVATLQKICSVLRIEITRLFD